MLMKKQQNTFVLSLGGSVFAPSGKDKGINIKYLHKFEKFIRKQIAEKNRRFFIVTGGGYTAREYRDAAAEAAGADLTDEDLDWLGIHATRLNAHLLRTIFRDIAHPWILKHYDMVDKKAVDSPVVVCGGWRPGWSSDYCAVMVANDYHIGTVINMSAVDQVYDKDPKKYKDAKPIKRLSWDEFLRVVGDKWKPGMNAPFDPIAAKMAKKIRLKVIVTEGHDLKNLAKILEGEKYKGTTIK